MKADLISAQIKYRKYKTKNTLYEIICFHLKAAETTTNEIIGLHIFG